MPSFQEEMLKRVCFMHRAGCTVSVYKKRRRFTGDAFCSRRIPFLQGPRSSLTLLSGSHSQEAISSTSPAHSMLQRTSEVVDPTATSMAQPKADTVLRLSILPQLWKHRSEVCRGWRNTSSWGDFLHSGVSVVLRHSKPRR